MHNSHKRLQQMFCNLQFYPHCCAVTWCRALGLRPIGRGFSSHREKLRNNLCQVVHTYVPLSPSSTTRYWSKDGDVLRLGRQRQPTAGDDCKIHLRADCLYTGISSGPNAVLVTNSHFSINVKIFVNKLRRYVSFAKS